MNEGASPSAQLRFKRIMPNIKQPFSSFIVPEPTPEKWRYVGKGAYGFVFFDHPNKIATKIFINKPTLEEHVKNVFHAEIEAHIRASACPRLSKIVPKFLGIVEYDRIIANSKNIPRDGELLPKLAYQMEFIDGTFEKCKDLPIEITEAFKIAGINYFDDVSIVRNEDGSVRCIIDFAIYDYSREL